MDRYEKSIIPTLEACYGTLTETEKVVADYFLSAGEKEDLSARYVAQRLHVSPASLVRFAKKLGFSGYREFVFQYQSGVAVRSVGMVDDAVNVWNTYHELLNRSYNLLDIQQVERVTALIAQKRRVYVYGVGNSGLTAREFESRFIRVGVDVTAVTDTHRMMMNNVGLGPDCLAIAISVSGASKEVMSALKKAAHAGAATVLITSQSQGTWEKLFDEVMLVAVTRRLEYGDAISPQFPILVLIDILYVYFIQRDKARMQALYGVSLNAILDYHDEAKGDGGFPKRS